MRKLDFRFILNIILNFTSSWDFVIFREYWISRSRCNIWCSVRAQWWHQKIKRHGLHGFALDQPSINGSGPINRSEKMKRSETVGDGRKRSETLSGQNLFNPHVFLKNKHFRATPFFLKVQRCPRGNGWKQSEIAPSLGKKVVVFFVPPLCAYTAPNIASGPWYPIFPKKQKSQELVKFNTSSHISHTYIYI